MRTCLHIFLICSVLPPLCSAALAQSDLRNPASKEWLTSGGDWSNTRYSALDKVNRANARDLKPAWYTHLDSEISRKFSMEGTPIVKDGVMYFAAGNDDVFALNAKTGELLWKRLSNIDQQISTICCGWDNRGVAVADGKVFIGQLDGSFVALSAKSGEEIWRTQVGRWQDGYTITSAPLFHKGVVYTGISGGDRGVRGKLTALDAKTGRELWHFWTVPDPGTLGSETWPPPTSANPERAQAYQHGGATVWQTPAIDPELGLIYFSTGQPGPNSIGMGADRPGDNLFSSSIVALHLDGTYAWHFQQVHHDLWDFDCPSPVILFNQVYGGKVRKGIAEACKTGWIYILDRTDGAPLIGIDEKPVEQDWHRHTSPTQPIPVGDAVIPQCPPPLCDWITKCIFGLAWDIPVLTSPGGTGGPNWAPMSYNLKNGYFYLAASNRPAARVAPGSGKQAPPPIGLKYSGTLTAVDSRTNRIVWQRQMPYPIGRGSGALSTAGGLLFHGEPDGFFQAYDANNGELLWQWQTGAGADAPAITYEIEGEQYVSVAIGGLSNKAVLENEDMIWTFSIKGNPEHKLPLPDAPAPPSTIVSFDSPHGLRSLKAKDTNEIKISDYSFSPTQVRVETGKPVIFTNSARQPYNALAVTPGLWDTGVVPVGASASVTFNKPGEYPYTCKQNSLMVGKITVVGSEIFSVPPIVVVPSDR
jgi:quinohemoprotein ethanol dehydrogenase